MNGIELLLFEANKQVRENPLNDYWVGKLIALEQVMMILNTQSNEEVKK